MNQGKMWLFVKPSFGIPFFLATVAAVSLLTHVMILTHTTWYPGFLNGKAKVAATP
jgi:light-harvesting protein B-800-850 alpha chain